MAATTPKTLLSKRNDLHYRKYRSLVRQEVVKSKDESRITLHRTCDSYEEIELLKDAIYEKLRSDACVLECDAYFIVWLEYWSLPEPAALHSIVANLQQSGFEVEPGDQADIEIIMNEYPISSYSITTRMREDYADSDISPSSFHMVFKNTWNPAPGVTEEDDNGLDENEKFAHLSSA
jgi:hypothetical protein